MSEPRWTSDIKGAWEINVLQCETCKYKNKNPMVCEMYPKRKPREVLKRLEPCPKYKEKE
ncbi:hypothetical protein HZI73_04855 [Vallitalea pronyensis]|uniref:Uncharacterized protein n=1 Tax=Vallitalea pronyensis TaxID=1348613 RepID=A0A8J8MI08_9FIRM|nr:hypothetical protein [Vallitalea pronyensis]QUI21663.1 hypothetical protein HZI73_04855 [Vallitalea pronyensis]